MPMRRASVEAAFGRAAAVAMAATLLASCGQKGSLVAAKPAASSPATRPVSATAPLPPPEPLEPPIPGTAPR